MGSSLTKESDDECASEVSNKNLGGGDAGSKVKAEDTAHMQILSARDKVKDTLKRGEDSEVTEDESEGELVREEEEQDRPPFDPENYDPSQYGPILPNGEINWECPCLGGAAHGPCGTEFRAAFSCFHYSKDEPKGADCFPAFESMHVCFSKYPDLYKSKGGDDDDEEEEDDVQFDAEELKVIDDENDEPSEKPTEEAKDNPSSQPEEKNKTKTSAEPSKRKGPFIPPASQPAVL